MQLRFIGSGDAFGSGGRLNTCFHVVGNAANFLIAKAYFFKKKVKFHLDIDTLQQNMDRVRPKRLALTHMSDDVLSRISWLPYETAFDGLVLQL